MLAMMVLGVAAGIGTTLMTTKVYQASVQLFVATASSQSGTDLAQGNTFTQDRVQSYTEIANSPKVTRPVVDGLHVHVTSQQLAGKITADAPQNKVLINIHVTDHNPQVAARLANAAAARCATVVQDPENTDATGKPVVKLPVIHPATVPTEPIKPN